MGGTAWTPSSWTAGAREATSSLTRWETPIVIGLAVVFLLDNLLVVPLPGPVGLLLCALIFALGVYRLRAGRGPVVLPSGASAALFAVLTLSVFWSDVPDYTGERLRTYAPTLAAAWFLGTTMTRAEMAGALRWVARFAITMYAAMIALFPWAREPQGGDPPGWHANLSKNGLGLTLALLLVLVLAFEAGWIRILELAAILVMSAGNQSRTSQLAILVMLFAALAWGWLDRARGPYERRTRALFTVAVATIGGLLAIYGRDVVLAAVDKDPTLSSRTIIWQAASDQIARSPWLGHGAFAFLEPLAHSPSQQAVARYFHLFVPPHAHNGVLDLLGQIGVVGLIAYAATLVSTGLSIRSARDPHLARMGVFGGLLLLTTASVEPVFLGAWLVTLLLLDGRARRLTTEDRLPRTHAALAEGRIDRACSV